MTLNVYVSVCFYHPPRVFATAGLNFQHLDGCLLFHSMVTEILSGEPNVKVAKKNCWMKIRSEHLSKINLVAQMEQVEVVSTGRVKKVQ